MLLLVDFGLLRWRTKMHSFGTFSVREFKRIDPVSWLNYMCKAGRDITECHIYKDQPYKYCKWKENQPPKDFEEGWPFCPKRNSYIYEFNTLQKAFKKPNLDFDDYYISFEYIIGKNGTRPDVLLINEKQLFILEFLYIKGDTENDKFNLMEHEARLGRYAADFRFSHSETLDKKEIIPALVLVGKAASSYKKRQNEYGDSVFYEDDLGDFLASKRRKGKPIDIDRWTDADFCGSPSTIQGAIDIFNGRNVLRLKYHESGALPGGDNLPKAKETLIEAFKSINSKEPEYKHCLCIITGVPGSGKTLLALDFMFNEIKHHLEQKDLIRYISASKTLIGVLEQTLKLPYFRTIKDYNKNKEEVPKILIYDEAQRAWDAETMEKRIHEKSSQVEKVITKSQTVSPSMIVAIIGRNQEIGPGEKNSLREWTKNINKDWCVYCPKSVQNEFEESAGKVVEVDSFNLDESLRYRGIQVSKFVDDFLNSKSDPNDLKKECAELKQQHYFMYITDNLELAKKFCRHLYSTSCYAFYAERASKPREKITVWDPRYGCVTPKLNYFRGHFQIQDGVEWFISDSDDKKSCCSFNETKTEYETLGLDLDMVILDWGSTLRRGNNQWITWLKKEKSAMLNKEEKRHIFNSYRVLMTRGQDGIIIYFPDKVPDHANKESYQQDSKHTYQFFLDVGFKELPNNISNQLSNQLSTAE